MINPFYSPYQYKSLPGAKYKGKNNPDEKLVFSFVNRDNVKYLVHVDRYYITDAKINFYALKFFRHKDKNNPNKFLVLANLPDCRQIFQTCTQILIDIWIKDPNSCLGAHGVCGMDDVYIKSKKGQYNRNKDTSRRFRVYRHYATRYFNDDFFVKATYPDYNAILIFHKGLENHFEKFKNKILDEIILRHPTAIEQMSMPHLRDRLAG